MSGEIPPLAPGLEARYERVVPIEWTIAQYDARLPAVFSTPAMIGMMEMAAARAVQPALPGGAITVGTRIEVDHLKAAPAGATVVASAKLVEVSGRFLTFEVEARNGSEVIGRGRVFRAIVELSRFVQKAATSSQP
jgi:fluoroacetyl-CoA thioesterase